MIRISQSLDHFDGTYKQSLLLLPNYHSPEYLVVQEELGTHGLFELDFDLRAVVGFNHLGVFLYDGAVAWIVNEVYLGYPGWRLVGGYVNDHFSPSQDWELEIQGQCFHHDLLGDRHCVFE